MQQEKPSLTGCQKASKGKPQTFGRFDRCSKPFPLDTLPQGRWRMEERMEIIEVDCLLCRRGLLYYLLF
jgi:hypothetical protein